MSTRDALRRAVEVLAGWNPKKGSLKRGVEALQGSQRGTALAWIHGVLRRRRTIGAVLGAVARRALKKRRPEVVALLEVLAFRVLYEGTSVEDVLRRLEGSKRTKEHVEHVIGALGAAIAGREPGQAAGDDDLLPVGREEAVRFARPVLDASARNAAGRLGLLHSLPDELVAGWLEDHGPETTETLCWAANDPPPLFGRVNLLRTSRADLVTALADAGVEATPAEELPCAFALGGGRGRFRHTDPWRAGAFCIQDLTAQRAAPLLAPRPGERVLDLCAAPGGKTTHLAELAEDQADVLACDVNRNRLKRVEQNARRLQLNSIRTRTLDGSRPGVLADEAPFDAVLVDAPCSNTGVLRRRSEARWRYKRRAQRRLVEQQGRILEVALAALAPGGRLVYSVCSIEKEEGEGLVRGALELDPTLRLEEEQLHLPSLGGGDGGYLALLRRA